MSDQSPYLFLNPNGRRDVLLLSEHAGNAIPHEYQGAIEDRHVNSHYGYDLGAMDVVRALCERLNAPAFTGVYSRLIADLNRPAESDMMFPDVGEGEPIPFNQNLSEAEKQHRKNTYFDPYHQAIEAYLEDVTRDHVPMILSVHSFTPTFEGNIRPWQFGVTWIQDSRVPEHIMRNLSVQGYDVGWHEPYNAQMLRDMSLEVHADRRRLPNAFLEIRNDGIQDAAGVARVVEALARAIQPTLNDPSIHSLYEGEELPRDIAMETLYMKTHMKTRADHYQLESDEL